MHLNKCVAMCWQVTNLKARIAVCCSVLQCVAVCCSVLQCVAVCCSVLQCVDRSRTSRHEIVDRSRTSRHEMHFNKMHLSSWLIRMSACDLSDYDDDSFDCVKRSSLVPLRKGPCSLNSSVCACMLQCVAVCCSALQYVAVCCSVLQCVAVCCSVLQCVAVRWVCRSVLQCVAVCCSVLQCVAVCCSVLQCVDWGSM